MLPPLAATIFVVVGTYAYRGNAPGPTFAGTALVAAFLAAWFAGAVLAGEPEPQADMATAALDGRGGRTGLDVLLVAVVAVGVTVACLSYPLALVAIGVPREFEPALEAGDVAAAAIGHLGCAAAGGAIGVLFSPPRLTRRATGIAAVAATLVALIPLSGPLGSFGGPASVGDALTAAPAGTVDGAVLVATASCLALAAAAVAAAHRWAGSAG